MGLAERSTLLPGASDSAGRMAKDPVGGCAWQEWLGQQGETVREKKGPRLDMLRVCVSAVCLSSFVIENETVFVQ